MNNLAQNKEFHNPHTEAAYLAGKADAQAGNLPDGWEYAGGVCEDSYRLGYLAGVVTKPVSELETMDAALEALRSGQVEPVVRLSDEQMAEIEDERPGEEICNRPWEW